MDGPRGKSSFAKRLGIAASTYDYYESTRIPPADVLVRIAKVTGVDLNWLLTGEAGSAVEADDPVLQRVARLLADRPGAAAALQAFLDILDARMAFPDKAPAAADVSVAAQSRTTDPAAETAPASDSPSAPAATALGGVPAGASPSELAERPQIPGTVRDTSAPTPVAPEDSWIPVLGRSAAGLPQFWPRGESDTGVTTLAELVARHCRRGGRRVQPARVAQEETPAEQTVHLVTLPGEDAGEVVQFVAAAEWKQRYPDAFAVQVDGESMAPFVRHGDLVLAALSQPPAEARPAIVKLSGQIGVTCKLYSRRGTTIHLVPINEQFPPTAVPADQLEWACRVLARVRTGAPR